MPPNLYGEHVWCWDNPRDRSDVRSLLQYIEDNSDSLRSKILEFYSKIGESKINGNSLPSELEIEPGVSFWWLTMFNEKSIYKSPLSDAIKYIAIEEILVENQIDFVKYLGESKKINKILLTLCKKRNIKYDSNLSENCLKRTLIFKVFIMQIKAIIFYLNYIRKRWKLRSSLNEKIVSKKDSVIICGYLQDISKVKNNYWGCFGDILSDYSISFNWLNIFTNYKTGPSTNDALKWAKNMNKDSKKNGIHTFIHRRLKLSLIYSIFKIWIKIQCKAIKSLGKIQDSFYINDSKLNLFNIFENNYLDSLCGPSSFSSIIWYSLFDAELSVIPKQKACFYICENQNWEKALLYAWKKNNDGPIFAVTHTTVRYWDLRYFFDRKEFNCDYTMPLPDKYITNGNDSYMRLIESGYPKKLIIKCEALRYSHLLTQKNSHNPCKKNKNNLNILILGDYSKSVNEELLEIIKDSFFYLDNNPKYFVQPHPYSSFIFDNSDTCSIEALSGSFRQSNLIFDFVVSSNYSSASVDAYISGYNVIIINSFNSVNFNPLRNCEGVLFVSSGKSLASIFSKFNDGNLSNSHSNDFFYLDDDHPKWYCLIENLKKNNFMFYG